MPNTGIGGSGTTNYLPVWTGATTLGNSVIWQSSGSLYLPGSGIWNSSGNVGIGTTSPSAGYKLDVAGNLRVGGTAYFADYVGIGTTSPLGPLHVALSGNTALLVGADGNVGIGTTSPTAKLAITGANSVASLIGSNLVTNGTFDTNLSGWTTNGSDWVWSSGTASHAVGNTSPLYQTLTISTSEVYKVTFDVSGLTAGRVTAAVSSSDNSFNTGGNGTFSFYFKVSNTNVNLSFTPTSTFNGKIDNVVVKQVGTTDSLFSLLNSDQTYGIEMRSGGSGLDNIFIGHQAGLHNVTGSENIGLGKDTLFYNASGSDNIAIGPYALETNIDGFANIAVGAETLKNNTVGLYNTAIGWQALYSNTGGGPFSGSSYNTAVGTEALWSNSTGMDNTAVGVDALYYNTTGYNNVALGNYALMWNETGNNNTAVGYDAGLKQETGSNNVFIGYQAGYGPAAYSASGNVFIGYQAGYYETGSNKLYIENSNSTSPLIWGDFSTDTLGFNGNVGIGTTSPLGPLHVALGGNTALLVGADGNVGIGTTSPQANLQIYSNSTQIINESQSSSSTFAAVGVGQSWQADDGLYNYTLPFTFPFFGENVTNIQVSTNGVLWMCPSCGSSTGYPSEDVLYRKIIAPLWGDWRTDGTGQTNEDIYIDETIPNQVTIRWRGEVWGSASDVLNFSVTLYSNGNIVFKYGSGNTNLQYNDDTNGLVVISNGSGTYKVLSISGASTQTNTNDVTVTTDFSKAFSVDTTADSIFSITKAGNVGIGTTTPTSKLEIRGKVNTIGDELITNGSFTGGTSGWTLGSNAAYGDNNVVVTYTGGAPSLSTTFQTTAGKTYLLTFTISSANAPMYFGFDSNSLYYNEGSFFNGTHKIAFQTDFTGTETIYFDDWNYNNGDTWTIDDVSIREIDSLSPALTVIGYNGATFLSLGGDFLANTALGESALSSNTAGSQNSAMGYQALYSNTNGSQNSAMGYQALYSNINGWNNSAMGTSALYSNTTGNSNSAMGTFALYSNTTGDNNSAMGYQALYSNTTGNYNSAIGYYAGAYLAGGFYPNQTSSNSLYLGYDTRALADGDTNEIVIGASAIGNGSNSVTLGNDSITKTILKGNVGIGTTNPQAKLQVAGNIYPTANDQYDLGSDSLRWANLYLGGETFHLGTSTGDEGTISYTTNNNNLIINSTGNVILQSATGNVGIGTTNPGYTLEVNGTLKATTIYQGSTPINDAFVQLQPTLTTEQTGNLWINGVAKAGLFIDKDATGSNKFGLDPAGSEIGPAPSGTGYSLYVQYGAIMAMNAGANVGIGTTSPSSKLEVVGEIRGTRFAFQDDIDTYIDTLSADKLTFATGGINQMVIDNAGNVGIGTTSPTAKLDIAGANSIISNSTGDITIDPAEDLYIDSNVGIGTTAPGAKLDVKGNLFLGTSSGAGYVHALMVAQDYSGFNSTNGSTNAWNYKSQIKIDSGNNALSLFVDSTTNARMGYIQTGHSDYNYAASVSDAKLILQPFGGNVGIGTTSPGYKLDIAGNLRLSSTLANTAGTSNYSYQDVLHYQNNNSNQTGAMVITVPDGGNTMLHIRITGYDYVSNQGAWEAVIGGYWYTSGDSWINTSAEIRGSAPFRRIRLMKNTTDGTPRIVLGETTTVWQYPQFKIDVEVAGYSSQANYTSGWSAALSTDLSSLTALAEPTIKMYVDSSGNVGIGTTAPGAKLEVAGNIKLNSTSPYIIFNESDQGSDNKLWDFYANSGVLNLRAVNDAYSAASTALTINRSGTSVTSIALPNGNVGIGTTSPTEKLVVDGAIKFGITSGPNAYALGTRAGSNYRIDTCTASLAVAATGWNTITCTFANAFTAAPKVFCTQRAGTDLSTDWTGHTQGITTSKADIRFYANIVTTYYWDCLAVGTDDASDLAEWYESGDPNIEPGHLVAIDPGQNNSVVKTNRPYDPNLIGGVPIKPAIQMGSSADFRNPTIVALAGRIPVKVTGENGPIHRGDYITSSSTPGYGMRATKTGTVVGRALEEFIPESSNQKGEVLTFVAPEYRNINPSTSSSAEDPFLISVGTNEKYEEGEIISIVGGDMFDRSKSSYDNKMIGVASIKNNIFSALATGKTSIKISTINGPIQPGDPLTSSDIPGVAMKATKAGQIVGKALEAFDGSSGEPCPGKPEFKCGKILTFVNVSWYDPDVYLTDAGNLEITHNSEEFVYDGNLNLENQKSKIKDQSYSLIRSVLVQGQTFNEKIDRIGAFAQIVVGKITAGLIEVENTIVNNTLLAKNIVAENINLTTENLTIAGKKITDYIDKRINAILDAKYLSLNNEKIISPVIETENLIATGTAKLNEVAVNTIKPQSSDVTIDLSLPASSPCRPDEIQDPEGNCIESGSEPGTTNNGTEVTTSNKKQATSNGPLAKLIIKGLEGKTAVVIDASGNASFSGMLTAQNLSAENATISGTLAANEASLSGKLIAKEVEAENINELTSKLANQATDINEIQKLLADIKNQPLPDASYYQVIPDSVTTVANSNPIDSSSVAGMTTGNEQPATSNGLFDSLTVTGQSNLYNLFVTNSLAVGSLLIENNSILSLSWDLKLSALSTIKLFDDSVVITRDGTITTKGALIAQGGIRTNEIRPISTNDNLSVQLNSDENRNSKLEIRNSQGNEVASIDASGSARFKELSLDKYMEATTSAAIIAASDNFVKNGLYAPAIETQTKTAGVGKLPKRSSEVVIYNEKVTSESLIYVTATSPTGGKNLFVAEKQTCKTDFNEFQQISTNVNCRPYFKVAIDSPVTSDINFNWWIIN